MAAFNPKVFNRPDGLKRIANIHLLALLDPWRDYFRGRGFELPTDPESQFPHDGLAKLLMSYDPAMPSELMDGLYYIDEAASNEGLDDLLERAADEGTSIAEHGKSTPADVAVQIFLAMPELLEERAVRAIAFDRSAFVYFPGRNRDGRELPKVTDAQLKQMATVMDPWFESKQRGRATRVFAFPRQQDLAARAPRNAGGPRRQA